MAIGTHLTAMDYLERANPGADQGQKYRASRQGELYGRQGFNQMVQSWLDEKDPDSLSAEDYLKNPVLSKSSRLESIVPPTFAGQSENRMPSYPEGAAPETKDGVQTCQKNGPETPGEMSVMEKIEKSISAASQKYGLSPELVRGVVQAESGFKVTAVSSAGAQGLMQLMPATARELGVEDPFDIDQNIDGGVRYLRRMLDRFENNTEKALAAYNAGPGTVERYNGNVPYEETIHYVSRVMKFAGLRA